VEDAKYRRSAARREDPGDSPKTLVESAYRRLRDDIVAGRHAPGERLRVEHLKAHYDVGAGTLREALMLLVSDALVAAQGQRGFRVATMSAADLDDITRSRVLIECEVLRQSIAAGDDEWEGRVAGAFHLLSRAEEKLGKKGGPRPEEWEERNRIFHEALGSACPSHWLRYFLGILYRQSERYRRLALTRRGVNRDVHAEHTAICEATLARDAVAATRELARHIELTRITLQDLPASLTAGAKGRGKLRAAD
jgi:DNA-binding GntR family transcriptional regulator